MVDAGPVTCSAGTLPAVCEAELSGSEEVDTAQDGFAEGALTDGEIGRGEIAPWIERRDEVTGGRKSAGACDALRDVIDAEQHRSTGFGEQPTEDIPLLGHEELAFEFLNLLELCGCGSRRCLLMRHRSGCGLRLKCGLAAVCHKSDDGDASRRGNVLQVGGDTRTTV